MKSQASVVPCAFCCNDTYAPYLAVSIASLVANTERKVKIYIFDDGISPENKERLSTLQAGHPNVEILFVPVNCKNIFSQFADKSLMENSSFGRLLIPDLCEGKKIIYCDSDTIFLGDIGEFYDQQLNGRGIGAVPEANVLASPTLNEVIHQRLGLGDEHVYFNAGTLLIDRNHWNSNARTRKLLEIAADIREKNVWGDQDVL
ncbi:MAG: hypothetical protein K2J64_03025, partial [Desulfovibrio sp.]|nr:hypothetical protein [Desulfovibrio sp.]